VGAPGPWLSLPVRIQHLLAGHQTTAIFRQINKDKLHTHHDALEFPDGQIVLLTHLIEGQQATVLQLPAEPATATKERAQEPFALIG
jgi:hypothetical protein